MASRFWINGTGTWDSSTTTQWAATSGGVGGQSVPTTGDSVTFDGNSGGGTVTPNYDLSVSSIAMGGFTGTIDFSTNNNSPTMGTFSAFASGGGSARTLKMGTGTWTITSANGSPPIWDLRDTGTSAFTLEAGASTIKMTNTGASACAFSEGSSRAYHVVWFDRGASTANNILFGSSSFDEIKDTGTAAHSIVISNGTTLTVGAFTVSGTSDNLITLNSSNTSFTYALTKSGDGIVSCDYLNIQHCVASPDDIWYAGTHSVNNQSIAGAGSGWIFKDGTRLIYAPPPSWGLQII